jgi:hypothetical protein
MPNRANVTNAESILYRGVNPAATGYPRQSADRAGSLPKAAADGDALCVTFFRHNRLQRLFYVGQPPELN